MSFATELTKSLAQMNSANRTAVNTALTTFRTSLAAELVTYGLQQREKDWADEQIYEIGRELAVSMRTRSATVSGALLTEAGNVITDETNNLAILLET